ncbi:MAG: GTPase KRas precursor [Candidatus Heimdallarchaeota archaeon LC_2]|nr:MAG: GTPase KRas precursor [Candidatus Heimdallarchaeota archaeon LC_2]
MGHDRFIYKVTLLGDGGVGKTSLRKRYLGEGFSSDYLTTIGADFALKRFEEESISMQIWDLAGQPRFSGVREVYYAGTKGAVLIYDITRPETFYSITDWITELITHRNLDKPLPLVLVANKTDLTSEDYYPIVEKQQGIDYAKQLSDWVKLEVPFIETSAKTGLNVENTFRTMINNLTSVFQSN